MSKGIQDILAEFGKSNLKDTLGQAVSALEERFGLPPGSSLSDLSAQSGDQYSKKLKAVVRKFEDLFSEISNMRSSYLPFDLALDSLNLDGSSSVIEEISSSQAMMESYENTFMRLLGMPSTADINASDYLSYIDINGNLVEDQSFVYERYEDILDQRQINPSSRNFMPNLGAFDMASDVETALDRLLALGYTKKDDLIRISELFSKIVLKNGSPEEIQITGMLLLGWYAGSSRLTEYVARQFSLNDIIGVATGRLSENEAISDADTIRDLYYFTVTSLEDNEGVYNALWSGPMEKATADNSSGLLVELWNELVLKQQKESVQTLHKPATFFKYSYLLFPPVQDGRIAKCINEPGKIVAEPFLDKTMRTIRGSALKSSLLEAIIRIRLDKVSGTSTYLPGNTFNAQADQAGGAPMAASMGTSEKTLSYEDIKDSMGLLEALTITRLTLGIAGFATAMRDDIAQLMRAQVESGYIPKPDRPIESDNASGGIKNVSTASIKTPEQLSLELELLVEDSLLMLFGDSSVPAALDLQDGTQRNSSVKSAHLMSSVMSILSLQRDFISARGTEIQEEKKRTATKTADSIKSDVANKIGFSKGVGALDILVIVTALFSMPENLLLSLLSPSQFDNLKKEFPDGFFTGIERETIAKAVNEVTARSYDAYTLFLLTLQRGRRGVFNYTAPQD